MSIEYIDKTHARLSVSFGSGKSRVQKFKRITYNGKRDAQRQEQEFYEKVKNELDIDTEMTVEKLLDWYIDLFEQNGGKRTTIRAYKTSEKALNSRLGRIYAKDVTLTQLQNFIALEGKSPKTIKNEISLLNAAYKNAIRYEMLKTNPCQFVQIPKQVKPKIEVIEEKDLPYFVECLNDAVLDFKVMCELALFCGMRRSEILGLRYADIGETITIDKVRHRMYGEDIIQTPKSVTSNRTLSIPRFILDDIDKLIEEQKSRAYDSDYLIQNLWGEAVSGYWTDKKMREFLDSHPELPKVTLHGLRHTYASMLINEGVPIAEVSSELGHASIDITLRTYTHMITDSSTASKRIASMMEQKIAENVAKNVAKDIKKSANP